MKRVAIPPLSAAPGHRALLCALADLLEFELTERAFDASDITVDAWVIPDASLRDLAGITISQRPCFVVLTDGDAPDVATPTIRFSRNDALPAPLSGRDVQLHESPPDRVLPALPGRATTLAEHAGRPVWAALSASAGLHHLTSLPVPHLDQGSPLYLLFHQDCFFGLLPLLIFLKQVTEDASWQPPPLQACFMFDDPNLHWSSYGYIDFDELAQHAGSHGYHAASATIPLDYWFVQRRAASLFRSHADQISLLIHGNDHVNEELARSIQVSARRRSLAQALWRIERLEARARVSVSRVMAPPHGACAEESLAQMAQLGYEAACISRGSLRHYNPHAPWLGTLGMRPCDIIRGMPVFSRFRISNDCHNAILVAALLRQPIIPVGHHQDVADGFDMLAALAKFIATLGPVRWGSMERIARAHYSHRIDDKTMHVRPHTRRVEFVVPGGVEQICIRAPRSNDEADRAVRCVIAGGLSSVDVIGNQVVTVRPGQAVQVHVGATANRGPSARLFAVPKPWPLIRRLLTETRDRLAPALRALS